VSLCTAASAVAQRAPAFEAASIKENRSGELAIRLDTEPGGRFLAVNAPLRAILQLAYGVEDFAIVGAPEWASVDRFDILAVSGEDLPPLEGPGRGSPRLQQMLQALLRERFDLKTHRESRDRPGLALVAVQAGRLGSRLTRSTIDCGALFASAKPGGGPPACGFRMSPGALVLEGVPLSALANGLSGLLGRQVIDRTGFIGNFDLQLHWDMPAPAGADVPSRDGAVSLFTALGDQAGLRLNEIQVNGTVLIVDSVQRPTPN
jgi:uncharacterized protein (TIGR03435 family)